MKHQRKTLPPRQRAPWLRAGIAALAAASLAGCASMDGGGDSARAAAAAKVAADGRIAPAWQAPLPVPAATSPSALPMVVPAAEFWSRFGDPALAPLLQAAAAASPSVAQAAARVERARATQAAAGAALLPQVGVIGGVSRAKSMPGQPAATTASAGLQASWEIDLFGANVAGRRAASARLQGAQAGVADAQLAVAFEVASTLTSLRACEAQARTTGLDAASRAQTSRLVDLSANAGFTAPADAALARAGAAQARATATQQRGQCDILVKSLVELTDLPEAELRQLLAPATAQLPAPPAVLPPALPAQLLAQRPDLRDAGLAVLAAAADRDQTAARELPQISLNGAIGGLSLRQGGETQSGGTWSIGPLSVNFPLFDAGSRAANTAAARAEYDNAVAQYRAAARRAVREVEAALVALQSTAARFDDARSAAADFDAALQATEARQRGGLASLLDLESARRNALAAQSGVIELQRERAAAWVTLVRALGAGWRDDAAPALANAPVKTSPQP